MSLLLYTCQYKSSCKKRTWKHPLHSLLQNPIHFHNYLTEVDPGCRCERWITMSFILRKYTSMASVV